MEVFLVTKEGIQDPDWNQSPPYDNRPLLTTTQLHRPAKISQKKYAQIIILKLFFIADTSLTGATSPFSK